jgi:general secretion pathway protein C
VLGAVVASAFFVADGVGTLVGARAHASSTLGPVAAQVDGHAPSRLALDVSRLFARPAAAAVLPAVGTASDACDATLRLVGSIVDAHDPARSLAAITDATGRTTVRRTGGTIAALRVVAIERTSAALRSADGGSCRLDMFATRETVAVGLVVPPLVAHERAGQPRIVDRAVIERLLADPGAALRLARVTPVERDGRVVGVALRGIRRGTVLDDAGLANGDVVSTVNGLDVTTPDGALAALGVLRTAEHLTVAVERRGAPAVVEVHVR